MQARSETPPSSEVGSVEGGSDSDDEGKDGYRKGGYHPVHIGEVALCLA